MSDLRTMVKKVNITAKIPIRTVTPALYGVYNGISMTPGNILKCLICHAIVDEVLPDGSLVRLTMANYNKDNSPKPNKVTRPDTLSSAVNESDPSIGKTKIIKADPPKQEEVIPVAPPIVEDEPIDDLAVSEEEIIPEAEIANEVSPSEETVKEDKPEKKPTTKRASNSKYSYGKK